MLQVTAVIPCHNHAKWVSDAITSVATQDYQEKRIVVVDDGSKDGSSDVVYRMLRNAKPIESPDASRRWIGTLRDGGVELLLAKYEQASGPSAARNRGMEAFYDDTDIFALLDSDDIYEPGKISKSVEVFNEHIGVVYSDYDTLHPNGVRIREYKEPYSRRRLMADCIVNCDSLVSKKAIEFTNGFDETLRVCEDYDHWLRISERLLLFHIPESLVTIRAGDHSSTATVNQEVWSRCYARVFEKVKQRNGG